MVPTDTTIRSFAKQSGFDLAGIASAEPIPEAVDALYRWLGNSYEGDMTWMARDPRRRTDPRVVMPGCRSVICLAMNYYPGDHPVPLPIGSGKVARYAWGEDYHALLTRTMKRFIASLHDAYPLAHFKPYVDHGPILERAYAARAGLGYIGKNTCLITMEFGSWVFLSVVLTDLILPRDEPETRIRCGACRRCMDACPTKAIVECALSAPKSALSVVNARKCISYQTIEKRGKPIDAGVYNSISPWVFGCDVCQEVCPHNVRARVTEHAEFWAESGAGPFLSYDEIMKMDEERFQKRFAGTALMRAGLGGLRNSIGTKS